MSARNLSLLALAASGALLALPSHAATLTPDPAGLGATYSAGAANGQPLQVRLDSALSGLALSNGTSNPFVTPATSAASPSGWVAANSVGKTNVTGDSLVSVTSSPTTINGGKYPLSTLFTTLIQPQVTSVNVDTDTGKLLSVKLGGQVSLESPPVDGIGYGGRMSLSDLTLDVTRGVITADVLNNAGTTFSVSANDVDLFNIGQLKGINSLASGGAVEGLNPASQLLAGQGWSLQSELSTPGSSLAMTGWMEGSQLRATQTFLDLMFDGLGVPPGQGVWQSAILAMNNDIAQGGAGWGTFRLGLGVRLSTLQAASSGSLSPVTLDPGQLLQPVPSAVPEPGAASLILIGLIGVGAATARKRKTATPAH